MSPADTSFHPDYAIHPGEILEEILEARGILKSDLAERIGLSAKTVSQIVNGKAPLTTETALQLERVLGVSAEIWTEIDSRFRLHQARLEEKRKLDDAAEWVKRFPRADLRRLGHYSRNA